MQISPLTAWLTLCFSLVLGAGSALAGDEWPDAYGGLCGGVNYGSGTASGDNSYAGRMNRSNQRLKKVCTDGSQRIRAMLKSHGSSCKSSASHVKAYLARWDLICGRAKFAAQMSVGLCGYYDQKGAAAGQGGVDAEMIMGKKNQGASQAGEMEAARGTAMEGFHSLSDVAKKAAQTRDKIADDDVLQARTSSSSSRSDKVLEAVTRQFRSSAGNSAACQNLAKAMEAGKKIMANNVTPNIRVLAEGANSISWQTKEEASSMHRIADGLDESERKLSNTGAESQVTAPSDEPRFTGRLIPLENQPAAKQAAPAPKPLLLDPGAFAAPTLPESMYHHQDSQK